MASALLKRISAVTLVGFVALGPVLLFAGGATAAHKYKSTPYQTTRKNAGTPNSDVVTKDANGVVISYGNTAIMYNAPSSSLIQLGQALFLQNCASCHGNEANGVPANSTGGAYPNLAASGRRPLTSGSSRAACPPPTPARSRPSDGSRDSTTARRWPWRRG